MKLLFSFCNTTHSSDYYQNRGLSQLGLLDTKINQIYFIKLPSKLKCSGISGLAKDEKFLYLVTQSSSKPTLIKIDKTSLEIVIVKTTNKVNDPHSILLDGKHVFIVSTGSNSIEKYDKDLNYKGTFWSHPETDKKGDQVHLNSIFKHKGNIWASCFGFKTGKRWSSAKKGYLINTSSNRKKFTIKHPHSARVYKNDIYYCESTSGKLYKNGQLYKHFPKSYIRGLEFSRNSIYLAVSSSRSISKSTGLVNNPSEKGKFVSKATIVIIDKKSGNKRMVDLTMFEKEVYDLLNINTAICIPKSIVGISKVGDTKTLKENVLISELYKTKEGLEKEAINHRKYISDIQSSRLYKYFDFIRKIESKFG